MKHSTHHNSIITSLTLALILAVWAPVQLQSGETKDDGKKALPMMKCCQDMKALRLKLREVMKIQDAELTAELTKMNNATDKQKVNLMASVITKIGEQRIAMRASRAKMEEETIKHMMKHIEMKDMTPIKDIDALRGMHGVVRKEPNSQDKK